MIDDKIPVTCSGKCENDKCYNILNGTVYANMVNSRGLTAEVMINPSTLWIIGK